MGHTASVASQRSFRKLEAHSNAVRSLVCFQQPDGAIRIVSAAEDARLIIWDVNTGECVRACKSHRSGVFALVSYLSRDGLVRFASGSGDRTIRIWDGDSGRAISILRGHAAMIWALASFTVHASPRLVSASQDKSVRIWDGENGAPLHVLLGHASLVRAVSVFGRGIVSASADGNVCVWDGEGGELVAMLEGHHSASVVDVTWFEGNDGTARFATASDDCCVGVWLNKAGLAMLHGHTDGVRCVSSLGNLLASGSADSTIRLWNGDTGAAIMTLAGHAGSVEGVVCYNTSHQDARVASASSDATARIWDASSGTVLLVLDDGHSDWIGSLICFTGIDGAQRIATASDDATVRVWNVDEGPRREADLLLATVIADIKTRRLRCESIGAEAGLLDALQAVDDFIGATHLKHAVAVLAHRTLTTHHRISHDHLHATIEGPPGTGKSMMARSLSTVLHALGLVDGVALVNASELAAFAPSPKFSRRPAVVIDADNDRATGWARNRAAVAALFEQHRQQRPTIVVGGSSDLDELFETSDDHVRWRFRTRFRTHDLTPAQLESVFRSQICRLGWRLERNTTLRGLFAQHRHLFSSARRDNPFSNGAGTETLAHWTTTLLNSADNASSSDRRPERTIKLSDLQLSLDVMRGAAPPNLIKRTLVWTNPASVAESLARAAAAPYEKNAPPVPSPIAAPEASPAPAPAPAPAPPDENSTTTDSTTRDADDSAENSVESDGKQPDDRVVRDAAAGLASARAQSLALALFSLGTASLAPVSRHVYLAIAAGAHYRAAALTVCVCGVAFVVGYCRERIGRLSLRPPMNALRCYFGRHAGLIPALVVIAVFYLMHYRRSPTMLACDYAAQGPASRRDDNALSSSSNGGSCPFSTLSAYYYDAAALTGFVALEHALLCTWIMEILYTPSTVST